MAQFTVNAQRFDPYKNFKFRVKWDGRYVAGISKVSGLKRTTEVVEHREGGDPSTSRKSPGRVKFEAITLERGVTHDHALGKPLAQDFCRVLVRVAVVLREVDLDDVVRRATQERRPLTVVDDVIGRRGDRVQPADAGQVVVQGAQRRDVGHRAPTVPTG